MQNPLFFRTYLTRLWLYLFVFPPIAIIMILGMADRSMLNEEGSSLKFARDLAFLINCIQLRSSNPC